MTALGALLAVSIFACGGGGSGGDDDDDVPSDGPNNNPNDGPTTDGPTQTTSALGTTCTPDMNNPIGQGSCPVGFACLNLNGATNPWCSKTCADVNDTSCESGYDGPGKAACLLSAGPEGGPSQNFCSVICEDLSGSNGICQAGQCDGTCPGTLACAAPVPNGGQGPNPIATACK